jgi:hypothetical protein
MQNHYLYDFFLFKTEGDLRIDNDYMLKLHKQYFNKEKTGTITDSLLVGRILHKCQNSEERITEDSISVRNQSEVSEKGKKKTTKIVQDPRSPESIAEESFREKAVMRMEKALNTKQGLKKSESVIFMQDMIKNVSFSNLLELY